MRLVTEDQLQREAAAALTAKVREAEEGADVKSLATSMARLVKIQVEKAKEAGVLLTPQQGRDRDAKRVLQPGDRARYVGPTRIEDTQLGPLERLTGQEGYVAEVHGPTLKFVPLDGGAALVVRISGKSYFLLERLP